MYSEMNTDKDFALALQLQAQYDNNSANRKCVTPVKENLKKAVNLGSPTLEVRDPTPNVHELFLKFNRTYFWGKLESVVVRWSKRMYSCAGVCRYETRNGFCDIALSEPLLKLRPRKDLVETLLHEMIHAFLFVTHNDRDRQEHGPNFLSHMHRINKETNLNISVYHTFHDEVDLYKTHWWRCDGPCQRQKPYFGLVKRSSNRAPGPNDFWWSTHQSTCGGKFQKIKEPSKKEKTTVKGSDAKKQSNIKTVKDLFNKENNTDNRKSTTGVVNSTKSIGSTNKSRTSSGKSIGSILPFVKQINPTMSSNTVLSQANKSGKTVAETVRESWLQKFETNKRSCDTSMDEPRSSKMIKLDISNDDENLFNINKNLDSSISSFPSISKVNHLPSTSKNISNLSSISKSINNQSSTSKNVNNLSSTSKGINNMSSTSIDMNNLSPISKSINNQSSTSKDGNNLSSTSKGINNISPTSKGINTSKSFSKSDDDDDKDEKLSLFYSIPPKLLDDCNRIMKPLYGEHFSLEDYHFKYSNTRSDLWQKASEIEGNCKIPCPICNRKFSRSLIEEHVNRCLEIKPNPNEIDLTSVEDDDTNLTSVEVDKKSTLKSISNITTIEDDEHSVPIHFADDFDEEFDLRMVENKIHQSTHLVDLTEVVKVNGSSAIKTSPQSSKSHDDDVSDCDYCNCPLCHKRLHRNDADKHLEECVTTSFANEFTSKSNKTHEPIAIEEYDDESNEKRVSCPCCNRLYDENEINSHLDECLL